MALMMLILIPLFMAAAMLAAWLWAFSRYSRLASSGTRQPATGGKLDDSCFMIMALLLAFTFANAYTNYSKRQELAVRDAAAIRTLWNRSQFLPAEHRVPMEKLVRTYVAERLEAPAAMASPEGMRNLLKRTIDTEATLREKIVALGAYPELAFSARSLLDALGEVANAREARIEAFLYHVPIPVVLLLILCCVICAFLLGRTQGLEGQRRGTTLLLIAMVSTTLYLCLDLEDPRSGFLQVRTTAMHLLGASLGLEPVPEINEFARPKEPG